MSFPRYPKYKASGVEWLGEVPAHWGVGQSRRLFSLRNERAVESDRQLTASQQHGVIYQDDFVRIEGRRVVEVITGADILKHVEPNDFVISMRSFQGGIEWCGLRGCISSAYVMLVPCDRVNCRFFSYLLKSRSYIQALQATTNLVRDGQALRFGNFTQVDLPLVPFDEQRAIAAFLDRETAKIDALVAEQQRLVELLKEKRQAVISHAVTKGLNPDAPMKPSGVEWLGDVPAHWTISTMRRLCETITDGAHISPETDGGVYPFVSTKDVVGETISFETCLQTSAASFEYMARMGCRPLIGDVLFSKDGTIGRTVVVTDTREFVVASSLIIIRPSKGVLDPRFLSRLCQSVSVSSQVGSLVRGAGLPRLSIGSLLRVFGCFPPLPEQVAIVAFLDQAVSAFETLIAEAERTIALLQERRTALISAAVTGQIDVRGLAASEVA